MTTLERRVLQVPVRDVARYFLASAFRDGDDFDSSQLHALCYYAQGLYFARHGEPLFDEAISASGEGPVIARLAAELAEFGDRREARFELPLLRQEWALDEVLRRWRSDDPAETLRAARDDDPWRAAARQDRAGAEIPAGEIAAFVSRHESAAATEQPPPDWEKVYAFLKRPEVAAEITGAHSQVAEPPSRLW